jgi:small subunit ribosomal protein S13
MRIAGINIPNKRMAVALTAVYGIGASKAKDILAEAKISLDKKANDLSADEENVIRKLVEELKIEGVLKREIAGNIKRLIDIKSYRGMRHSRRLPARGQRTRTNSRTRRGNVRKTTTSGRRKVEKK